MGKIISFLNPKGGVGKSTCVQNIAVCFHRHWYKVLMIDADPGQQSIVEWAQDLKGDNFPEAVILDRIASTKALSDIKGYDYVFVDGSAKTDPLLLGTLKVSDLVIIPLSPCEADVRGALKVIKAIKNYQTQNKLNACFLINTDMPRTDLSRWIEGRLKEYDIPILKQRISYSQIYKKTWGMPIYDAKVTTSIFDLKNKRISKLVNEIEILSKEIKEKLTDE